MLHEVIASHLEDAHVSPGSHSGNFEIRTREKVTHDFLLEIVRRYYSGQGKQLIGNDPLPLGFRVYDGKTLLGMLAITNATTWDDPMSRKIMGTFSPH